MPPGVGVGVNNGIVKVGVGDDGTVDVALAEAEGPSVAVEVGMLLGLGVGVNGGSVKVGAGEGGTVDVALGEAEAPDVAVDDAVCAFAVDSKIAISKTPKQIGLASLRIARQVGKLKPLRIRDHGAYCWRQTPMRTWFAVGDLVPEGVLSWVEMNWSSVGALAVGLPMRSVTNESLLPSAKAIVAGAPLLPLAHVPGDKPVIGPTLPLTFIIPLIVTFDDASKVRYPTYASGCPGLLGFPATVAKVSAALNAQV